MTSAISVAGLSKDFRLPHTRHNTVKSLFLSLFHSRQIEIQHALREITFKVERGEFFGIVGRNGSGKSTLLKILAGIYSPTAGETTTHGLLVPFIELGVGFNPELTGRENVYLNGALLGFSRAEVTKMYDEIVAFAELPDFMDQKLKNYSSGMQVRLAFSVATQARADILLIDEVLAVGDAAFQRKCFDYFRRLKATESTIVFVSHDMNAVREFCDRAILLDSSRVVAEGDADAIADEYTKLFIQESDGIRGARQGRRWGEGGIRYVSVRAPDLITDDETDLIVDLEVEAGRTIDEPVYGFLIKNSAGEAILGTNTFLKRRRTGSTQAGTKVNVRWTVPNIFSDGTHCLEIAITDRQGLVVYDWWQDAASFAVRKREKTPYIISPDLRVELTSVNRPTASAASQGGMRSGQ